jgi:hypothetical protein
MASRKGLSDTLIEDLVLERSSQCGFSDEDQNIETEKSIL